MTGVAISTEVQNVINYVLGLTTSAGDAAFSAQQALTSQQQADQVIAATAAAADLTGMVASSGQQMLQKFAPYSTEAADLLGNTANVATGAGLAAAATLNRPGNRGGWLI
jgi:hypothetical protein